MYEAEYTHENGRGSDFMVGVLCGAAVGAALGLLLAPKSGAEFRGQIAGSAERFRRRAGETYEQAAEAMDSVVEKGRQTYERASGAVQDIKDKAWEAAQRGREKFDEARPAPTDGGTSAY
jgi:gas vesicle protein